MNCLYTQQCGHLDGLIHKYNKLKAKLNDSSGQAMRVNTRMKLTDQLNEIQDKINYAILKSIDPDMA